MGDDLFDILRIPKKAIEMIVSINFLLPIHETDRRALFIEENRGLVLKTINKRLLELRKEYIHKYSYKNVNEFTLDYKANSKKALERLFQESLSDVKLSQLTINDPEQIFTIHSRKPTDIRFMNFLLHL